MSGPLAGADDLVVRLRKVEGQLRGLQQLAATGENLDELLTQLRAARGALHAVAVAAVTAFPYERNESFISTGTGVREWGRGSTKRSGG